jgi:hypothetical protein
MDFCGLSILTMLNLVRPIVEQSPADFGFRHWHKPDRYPPGIRMSQTPPPKFDKPMYPYPAEPSNENGIGLTGFIVSIVALFLCGIPSVIGILISLIGLRKNPKANDNSHYDLRRT